jgi:hypothetical protein
MLLKGGQDWMWRLRLIILAVERQRWKDCNLR